MISNEVDRKKFKSALQEISNSFTRTAAEKELIKEIVDDLAESFELPKKTVNKLARIYYKQNLSQEVEEFDEVQALYEEIVNFTN
jgi:uncharacterized protein YydD (DUF2326 family)